MTASDSRGSALALLLVAFGACSPSGLEYFDDSLQERLHRWDQWAPLRGRFTVDDSATCRVPHWARLHPEEPNRVWPALLALRFSEATFVAPELGPVENRLLFASEDDALQVGGPSAHTDVLALVAPWAGTRTLECGGQSAEGGIVIVAPIIRAGLVIDGLDIEDATDIAAENVAKAGLEAFGDFDLSEETTCQLDAEGCDGFTSEPPEPLP